MATVIVGALVATAGSFAAVAAYAAGPPVVLSLAAADPVTGAPLTEVKAGAEFTYVASVGCPDPSGCGPATLTLQFAQDVEFLVDGFNPPTGVTVDVQPSGGVATGKTVTLTWENLASTSIAYLPARVSATADASLNGTVQSTTAALLAGTEPNQTQLTSAADTTLRVYQKPALANVSKAWTNDSLGDGSQAETTSKTTATAAANTASSLTFREPSAETLPTGTIAASEAFDLRLITLDKNPAGATVVFTLADGTTSTESLAAGQLTAEAPTEAVGYEVTVTGLPAVGSATAAERTVLVTAGYKLRDTRRSTGGAIIDATATSRQVRGTAQVTNTVTDAAPGETGTAIQQVRSDVSVAALVPTIGRSLDWITASNDNTSVYGSGEASTTTIRVSNTGVPVLTSLEVTTSTATSNYFNYQELMAAPQVVFPSGATLGSIQYLYATAPKTGAVQDFASGNAVPDSSVDSRPLSEVAGIVLTFRAADGQAIGGGCALADDACAGSITLDAVLRDVNLTTGAAITAPSSNPGSFVVTNSATVKAVASTGTQISQSTNIANLTLVKPQFTAKLAKKLGDASDQTAYPLTGVAKAGDLYDSTKPIQDFKDHKFLLTASTAPSENATETLGSTGFVIVDPQTEPTVRNLNNNPFNTTKFASLPTSPVACVNEAGDTVGSTTSMMVWVADRVDAPTTITKVAYDASVDLNLVVGVEYTVQPTDASGRFPIRVTCETPQGTSVKFRDNLMTTGALVSPATIGAASTPGLLAVGNTAELRTGTNTATATGSDSLYLVEIARASIIKHYDTDAKAYGLAGQNSATAFLLAGVPATKDTIATRMVDTGSAGSALDLFAFAGARDAKVGPDQVMTISLFDRSGNPVGPVGTVSGPTELDGEALSAADIEDSQSPAYLAVQGKKRAIDWSAELSPADATKVYRVQIDVTRTDDTKALQQYGAFSAVVDVTLRSHLLSSPSTEVDGSLGGVTYLNYASVESTEDGTAWASEYNASAKYTVYEANQLFGDAAVNWQAADGSDYLVAQDGTTSRITLDASNKTALGVANVDPENQWSATGSIPVGVDRLSVGVGGDAQSGTNPFAITDFAGIQSMQWPDMNNAPKDGTPAQKKVAANITYQYVDGTTLVVDAPVGATASQLNPPTGTWANVVGVSVEWAQDGRFVGAKQAEATIQGRLVLNASLRNDVRSGFSYTFDEGEPLNLVSEQSIDGAYQTGAGKVSQTARATVDYSADFGALHLESHTAYDTVSIDVMDSSVAVGLRNSGGTLYRDLRPSTSWTLSNQNTGNIPVSSLRLATDTEFMDASSWPGTDPEDYAVTPGSVFDAFDVTRAYVVYPTGATSATVWMRGADGAWTTGVSATNGSYLNLPQTGDGPKTWSEVTGFRVQFDGSELIRSRIAKQATGQLVFATQLRATLRSDAAELSPATQLPASQTQWMVDATGAGASYLGTFAAPLAEMTADHAIAYVNPGTPNPLVRKFAGSYNSATDTGPTTARANPGSWVNFYVVLSNQTSGATSNLYNLSAVDTLPSELVYNAANASAEWSVTSAPAGVSTTPVMEMTTGLNTSMRWTWPADQALKPGERIVIKVPLQMVDGVAAGGSGTNQARLIASGIEGAPIRSVCHDESSVAGACIATANATSLRNDSVRVESYLNEGALSSSTVDGEVCDVSTHADWADGTWVKNPCVVETSVGGTLTYRLKLINSGNNDLSSLRFVDALPAVGDEGTVLDSQRGSLWTPSLVPGSVRMLGGSEATDLGARGDAQLANGGFRYSSTMNPCSLNPDAYAGGNTLDCAAGTWSAASAASTAAFGGDLVFDDAAKLRGGEYVIVEFEMNVPQTSATSSTTWNTAAVTARTSSVSDWQPASESPMSGASAQDTSMTVTLGLSDADVTRWHLKAEEYVVFYSCLAPGTAVPLTGSVAFAGIDSADGTQTSTIRNLPRGAECQLTDEEYQPFGQTRSAGDQYGSVADGATGYTYETDPEEAITLDTDGTKNLIVATNVFAATTLTLGVDVTGAAASYLPADATFEVNAACTFGGFDETYGPFHLGAGETTEISGLPVGADCSIVETDHRGASVVTATADGEVANLDAARSLTLVTLEPGDHRVDFLNAFPAGAALTIMKNVQLPSAGTAAGDVRFAVSCTLGGYPMDLGAAGDVAMSFGPGETSKAASIENLPVGAECTVTETETGGANIAAPDRTVTVLDGTPVTVEMVNTYSPAALELTKLLAGTGADESWVPQEYDMRAVCTRDLVMNGEAVTVTDFNGLTTVRVGTPSVIDGLPEGSLCTVTEADNRGAESTTIAPLTAGVTDSDSAEDAATVALRGPSHNGDVQATAVEITNSFVAQQKTAPKTGLTVTGQNDGPLALAGILVLLGGAGLLLLTRRRRLTIRGEFTRIDS
ncbi:DUF5979 domain-containing protein [Lysinibacter cavernae]|uniref:LPXTG-motif cell wall-anchored protein n=1 Tax=Lysinibacter cavernae TaxID=1640652 RepID=A0A7X5R2Z1_9MICO|nr:DUF5979 domain-containing protein [Lysinibacter cavernae]NIH54567.1 LPXTG-motif cell wall-anchored protein [Lysinibacter cavernae]